MSNGNLDYEQVIAQLDPEIYQNFKRAIEVGKWPDGRALTAEQKAHCMAASLAYEQKFVPEDQRIGYIDRGPKEEGEKCEDKPDSDAANPLKWA